ncbi:MAG: hypothetical protein KA436_01675 [Oligoflexales bacterium]|nr:hypothetical protein [Oligoflexales bacterium]
MKKSTLDYAVEDLNIEADGKLGQWLLCKEGKCFSVKRMITRSDRTRSFQRLPKKFYADIDSKDNLEKFVIRLKTGCPIQRKRLGNHTLSGISKTRAR